MLCVSSQYPYNVLTINMDVFFVVHIFYRHKRVCQLIQKRIRAMEPAKITQEVFIANVLMELTEILTQKMGALQYNKERIHSQVTSHYNLTDLLTYFPYYYHCCVRCAPTL